MAEDRSWKDQAGVWKRRKREQGKAARIGEQQVGVGTSFSGNFMYPMRITLVRTPNNRVYGF